MVMPSVVVGIARLEDHVYVLCKNGTVYVYDTSRLERPCNTIEVPELAQPCDVAVNREEKQLFIADNTHNDKSSCIWKVVLTSANQITSFAEFKFQLMSIAATSTCRTPDNDDDDR